jgi:hypothetical protein
MRSKPCEPRPGLDALLKAAKAKVDAMSPAEKGEMLRAQRKSWVVGEMMLEHPEMTRDHAERLYAEVLGECLQPVKSTEGLNP